MARRALNLPDEVQIVTRGVDHQRTFPAIMDGLGIPHRAEAPSESPPDLVTAAYAIDFEALNRRAAPLPEEKLLLARGLMCLILENSLIADFALPRRRLYRLHEMIAALPGADFDAWLCDVISQPRQSRADVTRATFAWLDGRIPGEFDDLFALMQAAVDQSPPPAPA